MTLDVWGFRSIVRLLETLLDDLTVIGMPAGDNAALPSELNTIVTSVGLPV